jgi:hypothetical protein
VDHPHLKHRTCADGDARTRGVHINSETLGIVSVLDQVEEKNGEQYPVETKHALRADAAAGRADRAARRPRVPVLHRHAGAGEGIHGVERRGRIEAPFSPATPPEGVRPDRLREPAVAR